MSCANGEQKDRWVNNNERISTPEFTYVFVEDSKFVEHGFFESGHRGAETISRKITPVKISIDNKSNLTIDAEKSFQCKNVDDCDVFPRKYFFKNNIFLGPNFKSVEDGDLFSYISRDQVSPNESLCVSDEKNLETLKNIQKIKSYRDDDKTYIIYSSENINHQSGYYNCINIDAYFSNGAFKDYSYLFVLDVVSNKNLDLNFIVYAVNKNNEAKYFTVNFKRENRETKLTNLNNIDSQYIPGSLSFLGGSMKYLIGNLKIDDRGYLSLYLYNVEKQSFEQKYLELDIYN